MSIIEGVSELAADVFMAIRDETDEENTISEVFSEGCTFKVLKREGYPLPDYNEMNAWLFLIHSANREETSGKWVYTLDGEDIAYLCEQAGIEDAEEFHDALMHLINCSLEVSSPEGKKRTTLLGRFRLTQTSSGGARVSGEIPEMFVQKPNVTYN